MPLVIGESIPYRKLVKLASSYDRPAFRMETAEDLNTELLKGFSTVGVTGASTPEFIIRSVCEKLENI